MTQPRARSLPLGEGDATPVELVSEFAAVSLVVDHRGNGPRLRIEDLRTGQVGYLDPLELETLAWLPEGALHKFLDPSFHRWRERPDLPEVPDSPEGLDAG
ncbi:hypothetical protein SK069_19300 [Patulibacter brassicae]|uniref:Dihydrodiol dehydrogenase n=1 Tax=Patulibacter brassicae TaxID=1705717 RepID=A0ABU4VQV4_9ACTN|nr:hypothetical protein [Patulibacter brassicae]MDX8153752.1 hypothetical protein [Patulibacter brassicae]